VRTEKEVDSNGGHSHVEAGPGSRTHSALLASPYLSGFTPSLRANARAEGDVPEVNLSPDDECTTRNMVTSEFESEGHVSSSQVSRRTDGQFRKKRSPGHNNRAPSVEQDDSLSVLPPNVGEMTFQAHRRSRSSGKFVSNGMEQGDLMSSDNGEDTVTPRSLSPFPDFSSSTTGGFSVFTPLYVLFQLARYAVSWIFVVLGLPYIIKRVAPDLYWAFGRDVRARSSFEEIKAAVLASPAVMKIIGYEDAEKVIARKRIRDVRGLSTGGLNPIPNSERMRKAEKILESMASRPNLLLLRIFAYATRKVWRWMYPLGIHISDEEMRTVLESSENGPLLLLPTHKSHIDYLLVTYMCFDYGLPIPYVVAGENLNIPIIGYILRAGGAVFIPRTFAGDNDRLAVTVFGEYIKALLERGHSIECFIEGGRSRTGKVLQPRVGVLLRAVQYILENDEEDIHVVPISLGYDRIVENMSHIEELTGEPKKAEKLSSSVKSISGIIASGVMNVTCYGRVDVRLATPFSMRNFINKCKEKLSQRQLSTMPSKALAKHLAMSVGFQTLHLCNVVSVCEPAALVATVLMTQCKRGMTRDMLRKDVLWLKDLIVRHGGRVVNIHPQYIDVVLMLVLEPIIGKNQLVKKHKDLLMVDLYSPKERIELSLYSNQIIHHFVPAGIVSMALYRYDKRVREHPDAISEGHLVGVRTEDLVEDVRFLSSLLKFEFIFPPSSDLQRNLDQTLRLLVNIRVLEWADEDNSAVRVRSTDDAMETYLFYATLFWRFLDSYYLVALGFFYLLPSRVMFEGLFIRELQSLGEKLYFGGQLDLYEAIAKETLINSISLFINWNVAEYLQIEGSAHPADNSHVPGRRVLRLKAEYQSVDAVKRLVKRIGMYRKSVRSYRSKRFRIRHKNVDEDAIEVVMRSQKEMVTGTQPSKTK